MVSKVLCPSMMCADFSNLEKEVKSLEAANIDIFHIDIMDGVYVPNFGMGLQDLEFISNNTTKLVDVHLMIHNPAKYIEMFIDKGADIVYFHPETDTNPVSTLLKIKDLGAVPGIAISPAVSINSIIELIPYCENIMIMTVNPGFSGQKFLEPTMNKIKELFELKKKGYKFSIFVDGAISKEKINQLSQIGVEGFVLGTSVLFNKDESYQNIIEKIKQ
ncbi:ribulose-phosphate 3-epimerase [Macrococcus sp. EM39E]|uniref:ribulose-phosphate 3-epimerase n=1 Tax=Macrococcus animalis TaxID=3395467 RepID=UPI0039BDDA30